VRFVRAIYRALLPHYARVLIGRARSRFSAFSHQTRRTVGCWKNALRAAARTIALRCKFRRRYQGRHVAVAGSFGACSEVGRGAELIARSIEIKGIPVVRVNISGRGQGSPQNAAMSAAECERRGGTVSDLIVVAGPPIFALALSMFSVRWLVGRTIVAHLAWELDVVDDDWRSAIQLCDEVWAASEFAGQALTPLCEMHSVPLKVVPYPVDLDPFPPAAIPRRISVRNRLQLADNTYVLGYSFAVSSNYFRNNPMGAVTAFQTAFPLDEAVRLILRALDGHVYPEGMLELQRVAAADRRIMIVEHSSDLSLADFYAAIDLYISPARAEGYGMNIARAAQAGRPIIAVAWSLANDVLKRRDVTTSGYTLVPVVEDQGDYATIVGAKWADPDIEDMAGKIIAARNLYWDALYSTPVSEDSQWILQALNCRAGQATASG